MSSIMSGIKKRIRRVGLYGRVSTDEQALKGFSIEAQVDAMKEYCQKNNMKIVDIYLDEGVSGAKPPLKRPALKRLLEDVEAGKIDMIVFTKLDRWFRSVKEYFKVQDVLDNNNVEWKAIQEDYDTTTANGQMAITIFLAVAQNERDRTAERIKVVLEHKRKNKEACFGGHTPPFGYIKEPDEDGKMRLVKDPDTQEAVQAFWDCLLKYNSLNRAIRLMVQEYGIKKDWKTWSRMTQRDFYCGMHKGVLDFCPAYVTPEQFLKFQERDIMKQTPTGTIYYFRGLVRCRSCGNKLCGDSDNRRIGKKYKQYRCRMRCRGCEKPQTISEKKIEKQLLDRLDVFMSNTIAEVEVDARTPKNRDGIDRKIKTLKEQLRRLNVVYMAGNKSDEEYFKEDAELKIEISKAEKELANNKPKNVDHLKELLETDYKSMYVTLDEEGKQAFWQDLIQEIKMNDKDIVDVVFYT